MSTHPFTLSYIGLGVLDERSIRCDLGRWVAEYRDNDRLYLRATIGDGRGGSIGEVGGEDAQAATLRATGPVDLEEFDANGVPVAATFGRTLIEAIGRHAGGALTGRPSRLWLRVSELTPSVYVHIEVAEPIFAFIPAMAIGCVCVPSPIRARWVEPAPGPLATDLGLTYGSDPYGARHANLVRTAEGTSRPQIERVRFREYQMPAILVSEFARALRLARGPLPSVEWRPILRVNFGPDEGWQFDAITRYGATHDGRRLTGYALVPDRTDTGRIDA